MTEPLLLAKNNKQERYMLPLMSNRHGLITGATVTLQTLVEVFRRIGVPVFKIADAKGTKFLQR